MPLLLVLACATFVSGLAIRMMDPMVPTIATDLGSPEAHISLLASAYAIPYALIQPVLGPLGDWVGKTRVIKFCLLILTIATTLTAIASTVELMFAARILGGLAGGGIIPLAIAAVGDHVPYGKRQMALSNILTASLGAFLAGSIGTGLLAEFIGWRGVLVVAALMSATVFLIALFTLRDDANTVANNQAGTTSAGRSALDGYARVFANPWAYVCYTAVFIEGILIFGLLPYVATLLAARGAGGIVEAGMVLAGMALGGLFYTQIASRFIRRMGGVGNLIRMGGLFAAIGYFGIARQGSWQFEMAAFMLLGFGFYAVHNSLQTQATELAPQNRGAAVALFAFFLFTGQAIGPLFYAASLSIMPPSLFISAIGIAAFSLSFLLAHMLRRSDARA